LPSTLVGMPYWYELKLTVKDEMEESLSAFSQKMGWSFFTRIWPDEKKSELLLYFKKESQAHKIKEHLTQFLKDSRIWGLETGKPHWRLSHKEEKEWFKKTLEEFVPKKISRHLVIKPTWKKYSPRKWETVVDIDPQMAFGTGHHFTTRFCLQMFDRWQDGAKSVMDVGCGSGLLAIAAAKLGVLSVHGMDNDPLAIKTSRRNAKINKVDKRAHFTTAELAQFKIKPCDLVFGNLTSGVLIQFKHKIISFVKPKGVLIVTGVMRRESKKFLSEFTSPKLKLIDQKHSRLWSGFVLRKL